MKLKLDDLRIRYSVGKFKNVNYWRFKNIAIGNLKNINR